MIKFIIEQNNGKVNIYASNDKCKELVAWLDFNLNCTPVAFANTVAEFVNDAINCKNATSELHDLNDTKSYRGTCFEHLGG